MYLQDTLKMYLKLLKNEIYIRIRWKPYYFLKLINIFKIFVHLTCFDLKHLSLRYAFEIHQVKNIIAKTIKEVNEVKKKENIKKVKKMLLTALKI